MDYLSSIPARQGERPRCTTTNPHQQLTQTAPVELQEQLFVRAAALPHVHVGPSRISVPGARAFLLDPEHMQGPREAFMMPGEFAHIHPSYDGSLHLTLPQEQVERVIELGWAELHPVARTGLIPATAVLVYGPRDEQELEVAWKLLQASHAYATGSYHSHQGITPD